MSTGSPRCRLPSSEANGDSPMPVLGPDEVRGLENAPAVGKSARFEDQREQNANAEDDIAGGENEPAAEIGECRQQGAAECVKGFLNSRDEDRSEDRAERRT